MRYIIQYAARGDVNKTTCTSTFAAELAYTKEQAAAQFTEKHPTSVILSIKEATEQDKIFGLGYYTDEERAEIGERFRERSEQAKTELEEIRERISECSLEEFAANIEYQQRRESEETQNAEGVHLGDILYTSWGYDQTNITFYQVVKLKGKHTIVLRRNKSKRGYASSCAGYTRPIRDEFEEGRNFGECITVRTKFVDWYENGKVFYARADDHILYYAEPGKLYSCSTGA